MIDIHPDTHSSLNVNTILQELGTKQSCEVALRGMHRFIKDYAPHHLTDDKLGASHMDSNKNYLVIGGLGNFGMEISEFIATRYRAKVFLTTRTNFPPASEWDKWLCDKGADHSISRKILSIREISQNGSHIEVLKADVSVQEDLESIRKTIQKKHGPISGIIHAAGIVESGMIQNKTIDSFSQVFAAKVQGTRNVCDVFLQDEPDFIILCSSMNSIIGGLGQVDNTAANAFVDAYAEFCVNDGHTNVYAINWGAVNEARARNYSALPQFSNLSQEHIKNKMTKDEIFDVYRRLFSVHLGPRIVVSTLEFNEVIKNWNRVGSLKELVKEMQVAQKSRSELVSKEHIEPITEMEKTIARYWQDLLGIDQISRNDDFFELGGNSLVAIQFMGKLTSEFPIKIHAMSIYEYPTLESFAAYAEQLVTEYKEKFELIGAES
ncbi:MAG: SDR family NAD(P)-dependent oxidoreductase [Waddliaceae bacterium]